MPVLSLPLACFFFYLLNSPSKPGTEENLNIKYDEEGGLAEIGMICLALR